MQPKYPIYIPTKGRVESRLTVKTLDTMHVPYRVVIEPQEFDQYAAVIPKERILVLPWSKPGEHTQLKDTRNWIKAHSIEEGHERHWQLDDNISIFYRLNRNRHTPMRCGTCFRVLEDFCDRYENVAFAGLQYFMFGPKRKKHPAFSLNTRIYSCTLVNNKAPFAWREIYNDDTDVSLQALKAGWCTVLMYTFLALKNQTMSMKGGNTPIYQAAEEQGFDGRLEMAKALQRRHPEITEIVWKWGRWQHRVDYSQFRRNKLIPRKGFVMPKEKVDEYDMVLEHKEPDGTWRRATKEERYSQRSTFKGGREKRKRQPKKRRKR